MLLYMFLFVVGFNILMFLPAYIYKTDKLTDISYALSFFVLGIFSYSKSDKELSHLIALFFVLAWSIRLGSFLFVRINRMKKDKRFDGMRENPKKFIRFWLLQGVSVFVVLLNMLLLWNSESTSVSIMSCLGAIIAVLGIVIEGVADQQKFIFSGKSENANKWIESGVWKYTRHPNYLGEMMVWCGLYLYSFGSLTDSYRLLGLISPVYIICLLLFVSGIPLLEKSADKRWGNNPEYQQYKNRVPVLIPKVKS